MLRIRTQADNRQLREDELQFESMNGAVSICPLPGPFGQVEICCVRGIRGRKAQVATLDQEALKAFIKHLQTFVKEENLED